MAEDTSGRNGEEASGERAGSCASEWCRGWAAKPGCDDRPGGVEKLGAAAEMASRRCDGEEAVRWSEPAASERRASGRARGVRAEADGVSGPGGANRLVREGEPWIEGLAVGDGSKKSNFYFLRPNFLVFLLSYLYTAFAA